MLRPSAAFLSVCLSVICLVYLGKDFCTLDNCLSIHKTSFAFVLHYSTKFLFVKHIAQKRHLIFVYNAENIVSNYQNKTQIIVYYAQQKDLLHSKCNKSLTVLFNAYIYFLYKTTKYKIIYFVCSSSVK